jgi:hypothetical protein
VDDSSGSIKKVKSVYDSIDSIVSKPKWLLSFVYLLARLYAISVFFRLFYEERKLLTSNSISKNIIVLYFFILVRFLFVLCSLFLPVRAPVGLFTFVCCWMYSLTSLFMFPVPFQPAFVIVFLLGGGGGAHPSPLTWYHDGVKGQG